MNFRFSVRGHDMAQKTDIDSLLDIVKALGIPYVQLIMNKALADSSYGDENVKKIRRSFEKHMLGISMLGAYFNPISGDKEEKEKGIFNFKECLRIQKAIGAPWVGTETGYIRNEKMGALSSETKTQSFAEALKVFSALASAADEYDGALVIEPAWAHTIYDLETLERLIAALNSKRVHVTIDLLNLMNPANFKDRDEIFLAALKTFGTEVKVVHLKDQILKDGVLTQVAPGKGEFHYPLMLQAIKQYCPDAYLTFEGVRPEEIGDSYAYLKKIASSL
jgi:L-ribulose-5-phosphate 3-epimerase